jgi:hypothetical protein
MAEVTTNNTPSRHVWGDLVIRIFNVSGASGSTLHTGLLDVLFVGWQPCTGAGAASVLATYTEASGVLTLTTTGAAMAQEVLIVVGRVG